MCLKLSNENENQNSMKVAVNLNVTMKILWHRFSEKCIVIYQINKYILLETH